MGDNAVKIDCASVNKLFTIVWDANKNGVLDAGDKLVSPSYTVYQLTEADEDPEVFARTLNGLTGCMTRILKGPGLFSQQAYLAVSGTDSTDVETLVRIGKTSWGEPQDVPDTAVNLGPGKSERARRMLMENWFLDDAVSRLITAAALARLDAQG